MTAAAPSLELLVSQLIEAAHSWGHHSVLRESGDDTIAFWKDRVDTLRAALQADPVTVGWMVTRENDPTFPRYFARKEVANVFVASVTVGPLAKAAPLYTTPPPTALQADREAVELRSLVCRGLSDLVQLTQPEDANIRWRNDGELIDRGEVVKIVMRIKSEMDAYTAAPAAVSDDYILPCSVRLPPATTIGKGCKLSTLIESIRLRETMGDVSFPKPTDEAPAKGDYMNVILLSDALSAIQLGTHEERFAAVRSYVRRVSEATLSEKQPI